MALSILIWINKSRVQSLHSSVLSPNSMPTLSFINTMALVSAMNSMTPEFHLRSKYLDDHTMKGFHVTLINTATVCITFLHRCLCRGI